jgi:2-polyprenyl-3-methyl-5-hydroxy-6-metoxy-1,4-benzoquinol methylase
MKIIKFSKSYKDVFNLKKDFYNNNNNNLKKILKINQSYIKQKKRLKCKTCKSNLTKTIFYSHKVNYLICKKCGHLNGQSVETKKFLNNLYLKDEGKNYSRNYLTNYIDRVKKIYIPKVNFLTSVIKKKIDVLDIGCGSGHFVKALELKKINSTGYDPNLQLIQLGGKFLNKNKIFNKEINNCKNEIINSKHNVLSAIGVLEHLENPIEIFKLFINSNKEYFYISVPLFSLSVFIENIFKNIYPRHLGGPHTHLYSKKSLYFIAKKFRLQILGEWWFGTDFPDLYRSLLLSLNYKNKEFINYFNKIFLRNINEFQSILDREKSCSEVHMVFKKK